MRVRLFHDYSRLPYPRAALLRLARRIYDGERIDGRKSTNCVLCSDRTIRRLNARYRRVDRTTDVLAFPYDDDDLLGEMYISLQRAAAQAAVYGLGYPKEIERLFVHGFLHLLGYTHRTERLRKRMEARERRYCRLGAPG